MNDFHYEPDEVPVDSKPAATARPTLLRGAGLQPYAWWIDGSVATAPAEIESSEDFIDAEDLVPGLEESGDQVQAVELTGALGRIKPTAVIASPTSPEMEASGFLDDDTVDEDWDEEDDFVIGPFRPSASSDTMPDSSHAAPAHGVAESGHKDDTLLPEELEEAWQDSPMKGESGPLESETTLTEQPVASAEVIPEVESKPRNRLKPMVPLIPPRHRDLAAASGLAPASSMPAPSVPGADELSQLAAELSRATARGVSASSPWAKLGPATSSVTTPADAGGQKPILSQSAHAAGPDAPSGESPALATKTPWPERQIPRLKPREADLETEPQTRMDDSIQDGPSVEQEVGRPWWHPVLGLLMLASLPLLVWSWATFGDSVLPERGTAKPEPATEVIEQPQPSTGDAEKDDIDEVGSVPELLPDSTGELESVDEQPGGATNPFRESVPAEEVEAAIEEYIPKATPVDPESLVPLPE